MTNVMHKFFFKYVYYNFLYVHVSSNILLILRRSICINKSIWYRHCQYVTVRCTSAPDGHLLTVTIPNAVLMQIDLLRMSKMLLETCTCREL